MDWIDEADVFVEVVNAASHGVGAEIERCITRQLRGESQIPMVLFIRDDLAEKISSIISGVDGSEHSDYHVCIYKNFDDVMQNLKKITG